MNMGRVPFKHSSSKDVSSLIILEAGETVINYSGSRKHYNKVRYCSSAFFLICCPVYHDPFRVSRPPDCESLPELARILF